MRPSPHAADGAIIMMEAATMPTVCLRFRFEEHPKIRALMEACADIQRQAVDYALENGKTATFTLIQALYPSLRAQHPDLHSQPHLRGDPIRRPDRPTASETSSGRGKPGRTGRRSGVPSIYLVRQDGEDRMGMARP
jgi:hypothetical protein